MKKIIYLLMGLTTMGCAIKKEKKEQPKYQVDWESLSEYEAEADWLKMPNSAFMRIGALSCQPNFFRKP